MAPLVIPRRRPLRDATVGALSATLLILTGCSNPAVPSRTPAPAPAAAPKLAWTTVRVPSAIDWAPLDTPRRLQVPAGWTVSVWARPRKARLLAFAPDGRLLVSRPGYGIVTLLTPNKRGRPTSRTLLRGLRQPHGLAFRGSTLYVAESHRIDAYRYSKGRVTGRRTVLGGLPDAKSKTLHGAYAHALKSVAVGRDGALYVSVGSTGNVSPEDRSASPQRATILRVPPGGGKATVYARGVRNGTGLAVAPDGAVWTAVNNRDNIAYPYDTDYTGDGRSDRGKVITGYVNDHPLEPLAKLTAGRDLGWPYCNPDPDVSPGAPGSALSYADRPFVRDVQTNPDGSRLDCAKLPRVQQGLGAHSAPLGLSFTTAGLPAPYGKGVLVGAHGSWNRRPPRAPEVAFFASAGGGLGGQQTLITGFQSAGGSRWGRPVMAVQGPDKAIYVSDDLANAVYRIAPATR
jgi:glucose/arabinose dehydrogenase